MNTAARRKEYGNSITLNKRNFSATVHRNVKISLSGDTSGFKILSLKDTKKGKASALPDCLLTSDLGISSCLNVEAMDTPTLNMDSLDFYFEEGCLKNKATLSPELNNNLFDLALADLDPEAEQSLDLQQLIEKTTTQETGALFPELGSTLLGSAAWQTGTSLTADPREDGQMPHQIIKVEFPSTSTSESAHDSEPIATISPEDLASITNALDGPVVLSILDPAQDAPELIELRPESPYSCASEANSTATDYTTVIPSPQRRGPKPKSQVKTVNPSKSRRRVPPRDSDEYKDRRARNNVAVRKSRDKAKIKQNQTEGKVKELTDENRKLQKKCDLLTKELSVLKGLFTNVGAAIPKGLSKYFEQN